MLCFKSVYQYDLHIQLKKILKMVFLILWFLGTLNSRKIILMLTGE